MKKTMTIIAALSLLGSAAAFAQEAGNGAPQEHHFRHHRRGAFGPKMVEKLGLTQAQQDQLASLKANLEAQTAPVRQVIQAKRADLETLWSASSMDRNAILAKQAEIDQQRGLIRAAMVDFRIAFNNLLTPQQQSQLAQMRAGRHG